jgi:hypothetical protein
LKTSASPVHEQPAPTNWFLKFVWIVLAAMAAGFVIDLCNHLFH